MKKQYILLVFLSFISISFISCDQLKQDAYDKGYKDGYQKGKEDHIKEIEERRINKIKQASFFNKTRAEQDIKYYFELYKPTEKIIQSSIKTRKVEDYKFNIQFKTTQPDIFNSKRKTLSSYIYTLSYDPITEKFSVMQEGYSSVTKY